MTAPRQVLPHSSHAPQRTSETAPSAAEGGSEGLLCGEAARRDGQPVVTDRDRSLTPRTGTFRIGMEPSPPPIEVYEKKFNGVETLSETTKSITNQGSCERASAAGRGRARTRAEGRAGRGRAWRRWPRRVRRRLRASCASPRRASSSSGARPPAPGGSTLRCVRPLASPPPPPPAGPRGLREPPACPRIERDPSRTPAWRARTGPRSKGEPRARRSLQSGGSTATTKASGTSAPSPNRDGCGPPLVMIPARSIDAGFREVG